MEKIIQLSRVVLNLNIIKVPGAHVLNEFMGMKVTSFLLELDLLIKSGEIDVDVGQFYRGLSEPLKYYGIRVVLPSPLHMAKAWHLRREYGLTHFDSLHASVAMSEGIPIISYDEVYSSVEGLEHIPPSAVR